jgi:hypothetical protein
VHIPKGPLNRELVCMRVRVFSCSLLSLGTRFIVSFNLYFSCINMMVRNCFAREFGYLVVLWCHMPFPHWFCYTFPHINVMYQEFVCTRI